MLKLILIVLVVAQASLGFYIYTSVEEMKVSASRGFRVSVETYKLMEDVQWQTIELKRIHGI